MAGFIRRPLNEVACIMGTAYPDIFLYTESGLLGITKLRLLYCIAHHSYIISGLHVMI